METNTGNGMNMNLQFRSTSALLAVGMTLAGGALTACSFSVGTTTGVSKADVESQTLTILQGKYDAASSPSAIACPGDLEAKVGATMKCDVTFTQGIAVATLTVNDVSDGATWDINVAPVTQ